MVPDHLLKTPLHLSVGISSYAYRPYLVYELVKGKDYFLEYQPARIIYA